nr:efflux RND transporter periplasmic adaptor subunit [Bacteroides intestinalis]
MNYAKATLSIISVGLLCACGNNGQGEYGQQAYPVITVQPDSITVDEYYSASIQGRQDVEIYPQVSGTITKVCIKEGERVSKGKILFVIDQVPYRAALLTATANVHAAQAQVETAQLDYMSKEALLREQVISEYDLSMARNTLAAAKAGLEQAKAQEISARNNLSYTEVKSPSDGVVGTIPYRVGALVNPAMSSPLTTVSDNQEMYVYFSMSENQLRALLREYGTPDEVIRRMPSIKLQLNDDSMYASDGRIETISGVINPKTGTVSVRAIFPNESNILFSGGIGNVIIPHVERSAIVIPQSVTYEIQDKLFAYKLVNGKAAATQLRVEKIHDGKQYIVRSGLQQGDTIVSEGVGLIQDGMEVIVKAASEEGAPVQHN